MMYFPLFKLSPFPPSFRKKFQTPWDNFSNLTFSQKNSDFHPQKFLITFFSLFHTFANFPLISLNLRIFTNFVFFVSPYFDHDAFMHHPIYVLDASGFG